MLRIIFIIFIGLLIPSYVQAQPPYGGTIFIDSNVILASDPSTFSSIGFLKQETRNVYDRRVDKYVNTPVYVFKIVYSDGLSSEAQVNTEFGSQANANTEATYYGKVIGQMPYCLRKDAKTITIHKGLQPFGGGGYDILIHTDQAADYLKTGILEETIIHEASHTSLDAYYSAAAGWLAAQKSDPTFISTYAKDNPTREDIAESFLPWIMVRQCTARIQQKDRDSILKAIPARLDFFDRLPLNLLPVCVKGQKTNIEAIQQPNIIAVYHASKQKIEFDQSNPYDVTQITLYDFNGKLMHAQQDGSKSIDVSNWPMGIYLLQANHANGLSSTTKLSIE